ncbi:MAG: NUDIX domain-containing protein [Candidatus Diapherotrites archaeon]|nr:NUDIX domain-containing protein [Candidatus Diapherotrites archaeon]
MAEPNPGVDFIGVGVGVMVRNKKGEVLLGLRTKNARNEAGKWTFPGGALEFGETLEQCAVREAKEEFGITVKPLRLLAVIDHIIPDEKQHWCNPVLEAKIVRGAPRVIEPHKTSGFAWFPVGALPRNITSNLKIFFRKVKSGEVKLG